MLASSSPGIPSSGPPMLHVPINMHPQFEPAWIKPALPTVVAILAPYRAYLKVPFRYPSYTLRTLPNTIRTWIKPALPPVRGYVYPFRPWLGILYRTKTKNLGMPVVYWRPRTPPPILAFAYPLKGYLNVRMRWQRGQWWINPVPPPLAPLNTTCYPLNGYM